MLAARKLPILGRSDSSGVKRTVHGMDAIPPQCCANPDYAAAPA